jgi:hypothetical protein
MGRPYNAYGRDEKCIQNFSLGNQQERDHLGDRKITLKWIF